MDSVILEAKYIYSIYIYIYVPWVPGMSKRVSRTYYDLACQRSSQGEAVGVRRARETPFRESSLWPTLKL